MQTSLATRWSTVVFAAILMACGEGGRPANPVVDALPTDRPGSDAAVRDAGVDAASPSPDAAAADARLAGDARPDGRAAGDATTDGGTQPDAAAEAATPVPLPVALPPVARFDGCRGFVCTAAIPEGFTAAYAWRTDGANLARHGQTLDASALAPGAQVSCGLRLADQRGQFGPPSFSAPVNLDPARPALAEVVLGPAEPGPGEDLRCEPFGATYGACADPVAFWYRWTVGGAPVPGAHAPTLGTTIPPGVDVQCHVQPVFDSFVGDEVASNAIRIPLARPSLPVMAIVETGDPAAPLRCDAVGGSAMPAGANLWWQIDGRAPFVAEGALRAGRVQGCDLVTCWAVFADHTRTLKAEYRAPQGDDCGADDPCGHVTCHPAGGCAREPLGGVACNVDGCASQGVCSAGRCVDVLAPCDDADPCTDDACGPGGACVSTPRDGVPCDDGDACTANDRCRVGVCHGTAICGCATDDDCDDGNPCTADACRDAACEYAPAAGACDDADPCTADDRCDAGRCAGQAAPCDARFLDADGDSFGAEPPDGQAPVCACANRPGYVADRAGDCDDGDPSINPEAVDTPDDGIDADCDGLDTIGGVAVQIGGGPGAPPPPPGAPGAAPPTPIAGDFDFGLLGTHPAEGTVERGPDGSSWCISSTFDAALDDVVTLDGAVVEVCRDADGHLHATVLGAARVAGFPVTVTGTLGMEAPFDYRLDLTGEVALRGTAVPVIAGQSFVERLGGTTTWGISASVDRFDLGPGVVLESPTFAVGPTGISVGARITFGAPPAALALAVTGTLGLDGSGSLVLSLPQGTRWAPMGDLVPLGTFSDLSGTLLLGADGTVTAQFSLGVEGDLRVLPGLTLTGVSLSGTVDSNGEFSVQLGGQVALDLADAGQVEVSLIGSVDRSGRFTLSGSIDGALEPLASVAGPGALVLEGTADRPFAVSVTVDVRGRQVSASLDVPAAFTMPGAAAPVDVFVHGEATLGAGAPEWLFQAIVDHLSIDGLGDFPAMAVIGSTSPKSDVDLFRDGMTIRDVPAGLTLAASGALPFTLQGVVDSVLFLLQLDVVGGRLIVAADLGIALPIVRDADHLPGIERIDMTGLRLTGILSAGPPEFAIESDLTFKPRGQDDELQGFTALSVKLPDTLGGEMRLRGRWLEPMGLSNFAIQNPAFTIAVTITAAAGIPVVTRLGWNLDVFWKKSGDWPLQLPPEVREPPDNVLQVGTSFLYDTTPSPSGLCLLGVCVPLPPMALRFDLDNLTTDDVMSVINDIVHGLIAFMGEGLPGGDLPAISADPFDLELHTLHLEASTHNLDFNGQPLVAGLHAQLNGTLQGVPIDLQGRLDPDGLLLRGEVGAIEVPPYFSLVGDPFQRQLVNGGGRTVPGTGLTFNPGGFEAFVGVPAGCAAERTLFRPRTVGGVVLALAPCVDGKAPLLARFQTAAGQRTVTTVPVFPDGGFAHISLQLFEGFVEFTVDGEPVAIATDTGGGAPTAVQGDTVVGAGASTLDDVRFWAGPPRGRAELQGEMRDLPNRYLNINGAFPDSPLLRRYEFDYDASTTSGHNAREGLGATDMSGFGAGSLAAPAQNPIRVLVDVPNPLNDLRTPALGIQAGASLSVPLIPGGGFAVGLAAKAGDAGARLQFHASPIGLFSLPATNGGTLGTFYITGDGRNLTDDGGIYDDGLYGDLDLGSAALSAAGALEWRTPGGGRQRFAVGDFALDVPRRYMFLDAGIDWTVPLAGGNIGLRGQATYNERNPPPNAVPSHKLAIHGDATIFGETFASVDATLEGPRVQFGTTWHGGVPPGAQFGARELLAVTTTYTVDFANGTACGRAEPTTGAGVTCSAEVCFHAAQAPTLTSSCNFVCGDHICGATGVPLPGLEYCGGADGGGRCFTDCGKCDDVIGGCGRDADCKSGNCVARLCQPSLYCGDGYCGLHGIPLAGTEACGYGSTGGACQSDCGLCPLMGICDQDNDCQSGACRGRLCVQRCGDGVCNGLETCGGVNNGAACTSDCGKCGNPGPCSTNRDCQSGYCAGVVCAPNPCGNGHCDNVPGVEQCGYGNGGPECEQDCGLCNGGGPCNSNNDCKSGTCTAAGLCAPCGDGVCSSLGGPHTTSPGLESCGEGNSGLSCEQDCGLCRDGSVCDSNADCTSGYCAGAALGIGICTANPCGNGTCDWIPGVEWCGAGNTQPMCQQDCGLCGIGGTCTTDADCGSDNCVGRLCGLRRYDCGDGLCADVPVEIPGADDVQPSCRTDCGLARPGGYCDHDADCRDGVCIPGYGLPGACAACGDGQCTFGLENCGSGDHGVVCESDCGRCGVGGACTRGADCKSGNCVGIACGSSCGDGTCDATESCGGSDNGVACYTDCGRCGTWGPCLTGNDCAGARICTVALGCQWPL